MGNGNERLRHEDGKFRHFPPVPRVVIDLTGPDGNAFALLAYGKQLAVIDGKPWQPIRDAMMEGDYDHLLEVFVREFGDLVELR